jgi:hypothetical protein
VPLEVSGVNVGSPIVALNIPAGVEVQSQPSPLHTAPDNAQHTGMWGK